MPAAPRRGGGQWITVKQCECWVAAMNHSERAALLQGLPALVRFIRLHVR